MPSPESRGACVPSRCIDLLLLSCHCEIDTLWEQPESKAVCQSREQALDKRVYFAQIMAETSAAPYLKIVLIHG